MFRESRRESRRVVRGKGLRGTRRAMTNQGAEGLTSRCSLRGTIGGAAIPPRVGGGPSLSPCVGAAETSAKVGADGRVRRRRRRGCPRSLTHQRGESLVRARADAAGEEGGTDAARAALARGRRGGTHAHAHDNQLYCREVSNI